VFEAAPVIFVDKRNFSITETSLVFIGVGIGTTVGAVLSILLDGNSPDVIRNWHGFPPPEGRLYGAMVGGPCLVIGIFWMGWTGQYSFIPWYVPALGMVLLGASITLVFISFSVRVDCVYFNIIHTHIIHFDRLIFSTPTCMYFYYLLNGD
jgi:hypothetical protein